MGCGSSAISIGCSSGAVGGAGVKRRLATLILPSISSPVTAGLAGLEPSELKKRKKKKKKKLIISLHIQNIGCFIINKYLIAPIGDAAGPK